MSLTKIRDSLILSYIGWFNSSPLLRSMMAKIASAPTQEGYSPEWLKVQQQISNLLQHPLTSEQLEEELGTRPCASGLPGVDIPFLNNLCVDLASQWPPIEGLTIGQFEPCSHLDSRFRY